MSNWERFGECNGCGDCCKQATNPVEVIVPLEPSYGKTRFGNPVGIEVNESKPFLMFKIRGPILNECPEHELVGCRIYETRPQACRDYPQEPIEIEGTHCSYVFIHKETKEVIRGLAPETQA